jgi:hypothetical protein
MMIGFPKLLVWFTLLQSQAEQAAELAGEFQDMAGAVASTDSDHNISTACMLVMQHVECNLQTQAECMLPIALWPFAAAKKAREKEERRRLKALKSKGEAGASDREGTQPPEGAQPATEHALPDQQQEQEQQHQEAKLEQQQQDGAGISGTAQGTGDAATADVGEQALGIPQLAPDASGGTSQALGPAAAGASPEADAQPGVGTQQQAEALQEHRPQEAVQPHVVAATEWQEQPEIASHQQVQQG